MLSFNHPNVMSLIGLCIEGEMPLLIIPFMSNGSLLDFVRKNKDKTARRLDLLYFLLSIQRSFS